MSVAKETKQHLKQMFQGQNTGYELQAGWARAVQAHHSNSGTRKGKTLFPLAAFYPMILV